jgi:hypothetical protein
MKRLFVATSFFALLLSPAAFAQGYGGATGNMHNGSRNMMHQGQNSMSSEHSSGMSRGGSAENISPQEVKQAQTELQQQGLYKGKIDGIVGPATKSAISQFQKREGLPQTASLDPQTMQHLMSTSGSGSSSGGSMQQNQGEGSSGGAMQHNQGGGSSGSGGGMGGQNGQGGQSR